MAATKKSKPQSSNTTGRKLAAGADRNPKTGGEPQKDSDAPRGQSKRMGSSKQRKGSSLLSAVKTALPAI